MNEDRLRTLYQDAVEQRRLESVGPCPEPEALFALIERRGAEADRLVVLDHVMACESCHREFELLRVIRLAAPPAEQTRPSRAFSRLRAPLAAAAAVVLLAIGAVVVRDLLDERSGAVVLRGEEAVITLVSPVGLTAEQGGLVLTWRAVAGAYTYEVEILDTSGDPVFSRTTTDTVAGVPPALLRPSEEYRWWVQTRVPDGAQPRSRLERFQLRAP